MEYFENTSIVLINDEAEATRKQLELLYDVSRQNLSHHITSLKQDGLVVGKESLLTASDGKIYQTEVYNVDEIISIGFRLRSEKAIAFQKWARNIIKNELVKTKLELQENREKLWTAQILADRLGDKSDQRDLYNR